MLTSRFLGKWLGNLALERDGGRAGDVFVGMTRLDYVVT
jgi:hypothetical protein